MSTSFKDLIPLRDRADVGEVSLSRPSAEEVARQQEKTKEALAVLISGASAAQKPSLIKKQKDNEPTFVRYTPADQFGEKSSGRERIIRIQAQKLDPMVSISRTLCKKRLTYFLL
jgi:SNW domain-containing protein 1